MSTYTQILYQVVFGSKYRTPFLTRTNQDKLYNYIAGIIHNKKCIPHIVGGYKDHIHLVIFLHPSVALSSLVREVKRSTHNMIIREKNTYPFYRGWQNGYSAFTYSSDAKSNLVQYVENQWNHHKNNSFTEELIKLLKEHKISYKKEYLFV